MLPQPNIDFKPSKNIYDRLFAYILVASLLLKLLWLDQPEGGLIFDEKYYVNVARNILSLPHDPDVYPDATLGMDPNHEHPFLGKGIISLSMLILGNNALGWRIPSVIFGTVSLLIFYLLIKRLSNNDEMALYASSIFALSNLVFVHSRIATLDIFMFTFIILGFYLYSVGRTYLSAISLVLATLSKFTGIFGFLTIIIFHIVNTYIKENKGRRKFDWKALLNWLEKYIIAYVLIGFALLTIFDYFWVGYNNPIDHISYVYNYNRALTRDVPEGIESYPWQWLLNEVKIPYILVNVDVYANGELVSSRPSISFQGAMNPLIIFMAIPALVYSAYVAYKEKNEIAIFALTWFIITYLPLCLMSIIGNRIMYLFYFLPTLPSIFLAISFLLIYNKTNRVVMMAYLFTILLGFMMLFPFRQIP